MKMRKKKFQTFIRKWLRIILKIRWPEIIPNKKKKLWGRRDNTQSIPIKRKGTGGGSAIILRKPASNITRHVLGWKPQGKCKIGRSNVA